MTKSLTLIKWVYFGREYLPGHISSRMRSVGINPWRITLQWCWGQCISRTKTKTPLLVTVSLRPEKPQPCPSPAIWKANQYAWVTAKMFEGWFTKYFVLVVVEYREKKGIPFNVLLPSNASGHPQHLEDLHPNVCIEYLLPRNTAVLQLLDQRVIQGFRASYINRTFNMLHDAVLHEEGKTLP